MAYRRKQGNPNRPSTFEDPRPPPPAAAAGEAPSLAAQAIRASSARRDSSLSSAYGDSAFSSCRHRSGPDRSAYEFSSDKKFDVPKGGFWGVLARKAKSIIEDDHAARQFQNSNRSQPQTLDRSTDYQFHHSSQSSESHSKNENPTIQKRLDAITSSLNYIGGKVGNALEEGLSAVENQTSNIVQETRKLNIRRKAGGPNIQTQTADTSGFPQMQTDHETQLKASRDVANAMAAKAKLLMRELKTVKADLAFAKERCSQLEEENKIFRESEERGDHPEDDDLVRLQLETLLAEKARLANENSIYARENRFLREIVEYHQLTMQDVVYLNEGIEEVTEVYHVPTALSHGSARSPSPSVHAPSESHPDSEQPSIAFEALSPRTSDMVEDPVIAASATSAKEAVPVTVCENAGSAFSERLQEAESNRND